MLVTAFFVVRRRNKRRMKIADEELTAKPQNEFKKMTDDFLKSQAVRTTLFYYFK